MKNIIFSSIKYKDIFKRNNLINFKSIFNYESSDYFTKNPIRNVIRFSLENERFYLKRHIEKYYLWPRNKSNAKKEWDNILLLNKSGFKTPEAVAWGESFSKKRTTKSFIITKEIEDALSLEKVVLPNNRARFNKSIILEKLALLTSRFHNMGFCHQDFYAGHIFLRNDNIYLIDVQRVFRQKKLKLRWKIKDLAQLNYSVNSLKLIGIKDRIRFIKIYFNVSRINKEIKNIIYKIIKKTNKIDKHTRKLIKRGAFSY